VLVLFYKGDVIPF